MSYPELLESDDYQQFESDIVEAIGDRVCKDDRAKRCFAAEIYENLTPALRVGKETKTTSSTHKKLIEKSKSARDAVESFNKELANLTKEYTDSLFFMGHYGSFVKDNCTLNDVVEFLDFRHQSLLTLEPPASKNTSKELVVAAYLAFIYHKSFEKKPGSGSGRTSDYKVDEYGKPTKNKTPFDRVCEIAGKRLDIKISDRQIKKAKQVYTEWYTLP